MLKPPRVRHRKVNSVRTTEVSILTARNYESGRETDRNESLSSSKHNFNYRTVEYADQTSLKPLGNAKKGLADAMRGLQSSDWEVQFASLDKVRAVIAHCPEELKFVAVPALTLKVVSLVDSLRSGVSKNSLITLRELLLARGESCGHS
jgi:hypothetical protein